MIKELTEFSVAMVQFRDGALRYSANLESERGANPKTLINNTN
jgi:hypothetical protein